MLVLLYLQSEKFRKCTVFLILTLVGLLMALRLVPRSDLHGSQLNCQRTVAEEPQLTVETMLFAKFGLSLVNDSRIGIPIDEAYLHYVRTSIARPSSSIPRSTKPLSKQDVSKSAKNMTKSAVLHW
jgi:hypothetical protein